MDFPPPQNKPMPLRGDLDVKPIGAVLLLGFLSNPALGASSDVTLKTRDWSFLVHLVLLTKLLCNEAFRCITRCARVVIP